MQQSITSQIKNEISNTSYNNLFTAKDFLKYGSYDTVKRILIRLNKEEYITRIIDGIYTKTKISKLTNEIVPTDPHTLALKIADNFSWKIIPTGNHALNLLGLSEQVPTTYEYLSTGPYRIYEYENTIIKFKNTRSVEINELNDKSSLVISAIRTLGKDNINDEVTHKIKSQLSIYECDLILRDSVKITNWIYEILKEICINA